MPVVQALFTQIAIPSLLGTLGLVPVLNLAAAALNRVDRRAFFSKFKSITQCSTSTSRSWKRSTPTCARNWAFGTRRRRSWSTWSPAWTRCGTGAYLVEVLERISQTLDEKGADALVPGEVKKAAMKRVFGFEILPAPFVIAHMRERAHLNSQ